MCDHIMVDFALDGNQNLLQDRGGSLYSASRILGRPPLPDTDRLEALIIDDWFTGL
jgi:hypothetical protein